MTRKTPQTPQEDRDARLRAALKANLARRKAQAKRRAQGTAGKTGDKANGSIER